MAAKRSGPTGAGGHPHAAAPHAARDHLLARNSVALVATVLTVAAVARIFAFGAWMQVAVIAGACAGLLGTSAVWAAGIAAAGVVAGLALTLGSLGAEVAAPAALAALLAAAVRWSSTRWPRSSNWIAFAAMAVIVANMWATTMYVNTAHAGGPTPVAQQLVQTPKPGVWWNDAEFYTRVLLRMRSGEGYYAAYRQAFNENAKWRMNPPSIISYRLPTAFWLWKPLLGQPIALIIAWLLLSTGAFVAGVRIAMHRVSAARALPAAAALATYLIYFGTSTIVLFTEAWAAALGVLAVAAVCEAAHSQAWRAWTVAGVALAVLACLVRELMLFLPVAGIVGAIVGESERRRFRAVAWAGGLGAFAMAYAAHVAAIGGAVSGQRVAQAVSSGGPAFFANAFSWATDIIGGGTAMLALFAVMAAVGIWRAPDASERAFLGVAVALPLVAFLFVGNDAAFSNGVSTNYWGTVVVPIIIALAPWAFEAVPGASARASG